MGMDASSPASTVAGGRGGPEERSAPLGGVLVRNTIWNAVGQCLVFALALVATPYIIQGLGPAQYGLLALILTLVDVLMLSQFGLTTGLVRYAAPLFVAGDYRAIASYVRAALAALLAIGLTVAVGMVVSSEWIVSSVLDVPPAVRDDAVNCLRLAGLVFFARLLASLFSAVPVAAQRFRPVNAVLTASEIFRIVGTVFVVALALSLSAAVLVVLGSSVVLLVASIVVARRTVPGLSLRPALAVSRLAELVKFSRFVALSAVLSRVGNNLDTLIIAACLPVAHVGFYSVPYSLCHKIWLAVGNVSTAVFPAASLLAGRDERGRLAELYVRGSKIVLAVAALPGLALSILGGPLLLNWVGPEFAAEGQTTLTILAIGFVINCSMHVPDSVLTAAGRPGLPALFRALHAGLNGLLFIVLIPAFGIVGAAIGYCVTQTTLAPWFIRAANQQLSLSWGRLVGEAYRPVALAAGVTALGLVLARPVVTSLPALALAMAAAAAVYGVAAAAVVLDDRDRAACLELLPASWRAGAARAASR